MSHLSTAGRKYWKSRIYVLAVYSLLIFLGTTMVVPFLITISGSTTNDFDYQRFRPIPRFLYSEKDRFFKGLVKYFNRYRDWAGQFRAYLPDAPGTWSTWIKIGEDTEITDRLAEKYIQAVENDRKTATRIAADYSTFTDSYPMMDTQVALEQTESIEFLRKHYEQLYLEQNPAQKGELSSKQLRARSLELLSEQWETPYTTYYAIKFDNEMGYPMGFQGWYPPAMEPKYVDFLRIKDAYRLQMFVPGVEAAWKKYAATAKGVDPVFPVREDASQATRQAWREFKAQHAPASMAVPFALRAEWYSFLLDTEKARELAGIKLQETFTIDTYNQLAGTDYPDIHTTPFPISADLQPGMQKLWEHFKKEQYPLRLTTINVNETIQQRYAAFLEKEIKVLRIANELLGTNHASWRQFKVTAKPPAGFTDYEQNARSVWMNFAKSMPLEERTITSSEIAYQKFLLNKYGSVDAVNQAYKWSLSRIEEAFPPLATAYTVTFLENQRAFATKPILANYRLIFDFLILNGNAIWVTFVLISLTILATLTVNPLCAYALSRFNLPGQAKILLFMLATMAFPAMVSAIPAYLLMRDLGLLNTFFALVLPGAANGMAIFILKGFFDSLPQELFEAATIDGAKELQIFKMVAMPMVKPILAINCVTAFITAYNGWQWALIICQDKDMWTLAVWMYQASEWWKNTPWIVSAGFVVVSIPTLVVFLSCQKIILRGIVIPSMK
ncbi:MAG: carbohydrate ABC transporter permease [Kiritimatiellales bacterium]|nr:carbohydrate ABC transporter permease [Kiritimatiellales bacterium]